LFEDKEDETKLVIVASVNKIIPNKLLSRWGLQ